MHKIYQDRGKYNILYQIPQILHPTLISKLIDPIIKILALSQDDIIEFKKEKVKIKINEKHNKLLKTLRRKFISFFVLTFIILLFFWYYITCFCGIYINTQIHLIKDSISSLLTSLLVYSFILNLIPGIFRIPALKSKNSNHIYLYKLSLFIQYFY